MRGTARPPDTPPEVRSELQRFAAEELRSELNTWAERIRVQTQEVVKEEMKKAMQELPMLRKLPSKDVDSSVLDQEQSEDGRGSTFHPRVSDYTPSTDMGGGWVGRLLSNLKVPLGDGIDDAEVISGTAGTHNSRQSYSSLSETILPDPEADVQESSSSREVEIAPNRERPSTRKSERLDRRSRAVRKSRMSHWSRQSSKPRKSQLVQDYNDHYIPQCAQEIVDQTFFDHLVCGIIVVNAFMLGIEADWEVEHLTVEHPPFFKFCDLLFCLFFAVEIILRVVAYGPWFFSCGTPDWTWNYFDLCIVLLQIAEVALSFSGLALNPTLNVFKVFRVIRLCRCARIFRLVRVFRLVPELHMLVVTCAGSMRSLFWTVMLLLFTTYTFGMYLTQIVAEHEMSHPEDTAQKRDLQQFFGSIVKAVFKLFQTMFNGDDWHRLTKPLIEDINPWLGVVFSLYVAFTVICLLNVITGVFLTSAMQTAEDDRNRRIIEEIRRLFQKADLDDSGNISIEEFEMYLDHPEMQVYLRSIDLLPDEAAELFFLLDKDQSGEVSLKEFTHGCMRLRGNAKAVDFAVFVSNYERQCQRQYKKIEKVERMIHQFVDALPEAIIESAEPS